MTKNQLFIDFETYSSVDITKSGAYKYTESFDFEILMVAYAFNDGPIHMVDLAQKDELPLEFIKALRDRNVEKHAHNATFERLCLKAIGFDVPIDQWHCSAIKAAYCGLPLHLDGVSQALNLGDKGKSASGKALIRFFSIPCKPTKKNGGRRRNLPEHDPEKWEEFKKYCIQDVEAERAIIKILEPYNVPDFEQVLYTLDQRINDKGVMIDVDLAQTAIKLDTLNSEQIASEMIALTGLENPNSPAQLKGWLSKAFGEPVETLAKGEIPNLIEKAPSGTVKKVLELRVKAAKTSIKKYLKMVESVCDDQRGHGYLQFYGANRTGRWAGRMLQLQNLPQNHLPEIEQDRAFIKSGDLSLLRILYDDISSILSQLIRTALIAKPGHTFAVADFSAIEARVIAWLSDETWRLDVFNTHGKIYEASASMMFGVPIEYVTKGSDYRAKGKVAELALGYQGSVGALRQMGGEAMGLSEAEMKGIVRKWRKANPNIVKLWQIVEQGVMVATQKRRRVVGPKGIIFAHDGTYLTLQLPSGRKLFYYKAKLSKNRFGGDSIKYQGVDQETKKWTYIESYGGKFVENCLAYDTEVLTDKGWKNIIDVKKADMLWDGVEWVQHGGLVCQGVKQTISINGVRMTPDHKILTNEGWKNASQSEGLKRYKNARYNCCKVSRFKRKKIHLGDGMRLWKDISNDSFRIFKRETEIMRMQKVQGNIREKKNSRNEQAPGLRSMAFFISTLLSPKSQSLPKLRRSRYISLRPLANVFRKFLDRYGWVLQKKVDYRESRRQRGLFTRKLQMGNIKTASSKQKKQYSDRYEVGENNSSGSFGKIRNWSNDFALQIKNQLSSERFICKTGHKEQVYDLINSGPRHRFMVRSSGGEPFIVHNCVQAIARDLLAVSMIQLDRKGFDIVMHVHDEAICEILDENTEEKLKKMCQIMGETPAWAEGLPLNADGYITPFYKKD